ncbi:hypothetical protein BO71DRAFT_413437 [Aspergillus ellipticus CBS 707.79]|uniref:Rhodopsin domain-containing protein n=1 Tax=Aspergillus ellipticus CBS 707.79 TaxID=1448320 RepID=A0A319CW87_9EURO|nr:hypothetical protein BO71DRAFT_413437 [Aspergillus ellipticus CBS 707.79]
MSSKYLDSRGHSSGSQQASVFGIGIACMAFTSVVIALRIYVRTIVLRALGADDNLDIRFDHRVHSGQAVWATRVLYVAGLGFIKMCLLWFYLRLEARPVMKWLVHSVIIFVLGVSISSLIVDLVACIPISKFWDPSESGRCMSSASQQMFYEVNGILVIVMDIMVWIVPIPMLWHVHISLPVSPLPKPPPMRNPTTDTTPAACVRYNTVLQLAQNPDETYVLAASLNWCGIEAYVAVFCGSTPSLWVLAKRTLPRLLGTSRGERSNSTYAVQRVSKRFSGAPFRDQRSTGGSRSGESQHALHDGGGIMMKTDIHWEVADRGVEGLEFGVKG